MFSELEPMTAPKTQLQSGCEDKLPDVNTKQTKRLTDTAFTALKLQRVRFEMFCISATVRFTSFKKMASWQLVRSSLLYVFSYISVLRVYTFIHMQYVQLFSNVKIKPNSTDTTFKFRHSYTGKLNL